MPFSVAGSFAMPSSASVESTDAIANAREFIKDKLYFTSTPYVPAQTPSVHYFTIDDTLVYMNFYADFGPNNLSHVLRFIELLGQKFNNPATASKKICLYSSMEGDKRANAAYLICAYMVIALKRTPEEAYKPLMGTAPPFLPYRDAGYGPATYHITVLDCLRGLYKGLTVGLLQLDTLDLEEYEFYEKVENGDFNWLTDKFLALASPHDDPPHAAHFAHQQALAARGLLPSQMGYNGIFSAFSKPRKSRFQSCYRVEDLIAYLKEKGVTTIIRLNNKLYDRKKFQDAGIEHIELYFPDGTTPPDHILKKFLEIVESRTGGIAIHCKAGLGRTGSLIAAYMMKHYKMTAAEVIAYLRLMRPGSVVGPQQNYLQAMQQRLFRLHPSTKLPSEISRLRNPSFFSCKRFDHCIPAGVQPSSAPMDIDEDFNGKFEFEVEDTESSVEVGLGSNLNNKTANYQIPAQPRKAGTYMEDEKKERTESALLSSAAAAPSTIWGWERSITNTSNVRTNAVTASANYNAAANGTRYNLRSTLKSAGAERKEDRQLTDFVLHGSARLTQPNVLGDK